MAGERDPRAMRRYQVQRRRLPALIVALAVVAGIVVGVVWALGRVGGKTAQPAAQPPPPPPQVVPQKPTVPPRLEDRARAAVKRFVELGLPLYCGGGKKGRYVALTFDDGPGPYTERYAFKILRQARARATWFAIGRLISGSEATVRRELAFGPVGDHTWSHRYLPGLGAAQMATEIASAQNAIEGATGRPVTLFRPPYGGHTAAIDAEVKSLGMLTVLWTVDSLDSQGADWRRITKTVLNDLRPGAIVVLHENRGQTIRALKFRILPELRRRGYETVTIPELLALDPPSMAQLRAGWKGCQTARPRAGRTGR